MPLFLGLSIALLVPATAAAQASGPAAVEIVVDASATMNAPVPGGDTRLDTVRRALETALASLPPSARVAFRAFGHRVSREQKNCEDTELLSNFARPAALRGHLGSLFGILHAQGLSSAGKSLVDAAADFGEDLPTRRAIILIGDGRESCAGDPCAAVVGLANNEIPVHTITLGGNPAAHLQNQCIARMTGGSSFEASDAPSLAQAIASAVAAERQELPFPLDDEEPGEIEVTAPDAKGHKVIDSTRGKGVGEVTTKKRVLRVRPGIYEVRFGPVSWKGVRVETDQRTTLAPGQIRVGTSGIRHEVVDSETGDVVAVLERGNSAASLVPGLYDVTFGGAVWTFVKVDAGAATVLEPGAVRVLNPRVGGQYLVRTASGREAGTVTSGGASLALPPGSYTLALASRTVSFTAVSGRTVEIDAAGR